MIRQYLPKIILMLLIPTQIISAVNISQLKTFNVNGKVKKSMKTLSTGPDLILHNANVMTMDSLPNVQAIAIEGNLISAVGTDDDVLALQTAHTQLIDLEGRTIVPGLIEAHTHLLKRGYQNDGIEGLKRAAQGMAADGYTTAHEIHPGNLDYLEAARELAEQGELAVRIDFYLAYNRASGMIVPNNWNSYPYTSRIDTVIRIVGVKMFADGGAVNRPCITTLYQIGPAAGTHGDLYLSQSEIDSVVSMILDAGYPIAMHAIGDSAIGVGLNAFESAFAGNGNTLRCRMEHVVIMRQDLADQMATLGVAASIQYTWARAARAQRVEEYYEPQVLEWYWPWRRMADRGIPIVGSNDAPPAAYRSQAMQTISILATRKMRPGEELAIWMDGDQLTVEEGLHAMTVTNAWVVFEDEMKGTITPGKLADLTVLSDDPLAMNPFDVRYISIEMTIMDGIIRHNQVGITHTAIHDAGSFSVGIDDRGLWGPRRSLVGLQYNGFEQLYHGSILISYDTSTVATATYPQEDYVTSPGGWMDFHEPGNIATEEATVIYEDAAAWHPGRLRITQRTFMWEGESFLLVKYTFKNIGTDPLSDIYLGQLMDFEIVDWTNDMGGWELNNGLGFAYMYDASDTSAPFIGVAMFNSSGNYVNSSLTFTKGMNPDRGHKEPFFSQSMRSGIIQSITSEPNDYAILISTGPINLDVDQSISPFMLAFVAGKNLEELKDAVNQAYYRSTSLTQISRMENETPADFVVFQNYPNPFNPFTTITYQLPKAAKVNVSIYNTSGQVVETLVSESQRAGFHKIQWNADQFGSGVYFYRIKAGEFEEVKKCIFLK